MVTIKISENRTEGMSRSEVSDALYAGTVRLCPYTELNASDVDGVFTGFLSIGAGSPKEPRTMSVLALGTSVGGVPCARVECVGPGGASTIYEPSVCEFCPRLGGCTPGDRYAVEHDFWDDAPDDEDTGD